MLLYFPPSALKEMIILNFPHGSSKLTQSISKYQIESTYKYFDGLKFITDCYSLCIPQAQAPWVQVQGSQVSRQVVGVLLLEVVQVQCCHLMGRWRCQRNHRILPVRHIQYNHDHQGQLPNCYLETESGGKDLIGVFVCLYN